MSSSWGDYSGKAVNGASTRRNRTFTARRRPGYHSTAMYTAAIKIPILLAGLALAACTPTPPASYADAYRNALSRYPGTKDVTPAMTDRFIAYFDGSGGDQSAGAAATVDAADLYGERAYFSDTLLTTEDRATLLRHLRRMHDSAQRLDVRLIDRQIDGQDAYLVWQMSATFDAAGSVNSNTLGVTHLRFDEDGRIVLHQDFWDSSEGLYRHLPVLGQLINLVQGRFGDGG